MPPDQVEIVCAHCHSKLEMPDPLMVPTEPFVCGKCGAVITTDLVRVVHHVSTKVRAWPTDYQTEDPTPVQTPVPLPKMRE